jgi:hypothetical protein
LAVRNELSREVDFVASMDPRTLSAKKMAVRIKLSAREMDFVASIGPPV